MVAEGRGARFAAASARGGKEQDVDLAELAGNVAAGTAVLLDERLVCERSAVHASEPGPEGAIHLRGQGVELIPVEFGLVRHAMSPIPLVRPSVGVESVFCPRRGWRGRR